MHMYMYKHFKVFTSNCNNNSSQTIVLLALSILKHFSPLFSHLLYHATISFYLL